jgi:small subunit ribosomal protein S9
MTETTVPDETPVVADEAPEAAATEAPAEETAVAEAVATEAPAEAAATEAPAEETAVEESTPEEPAAAPAPAVVRPRFDRPIQTVGRRKEAIVRVRIIPGTGKITCNGRELAQYFPSKVHQQLIQEPLVTAEKAEIFDVIANLRGGGITGQAGALRLGIARALIENEPEDRPALKKAGFLTRDARVKESKKYGLKKARKAPQYSKR